MQNKPLKLSIIIPAYNEESNIAALLESIANQTSKPDEVVVIDNNCSDGTVEIAKQFGFVTVIRESKQGIVHARDAGFNYTKCDIIARTDGDTILDPKWVENIRKHYSKSSSKHTAITGTGYFINLAFPPAKINSAIQTLITFRFNKLIVGHYILWGSNMAMLRADWLEVRDQTCKLTNIHEDLDLAIHLNKIGVNIIYKKNLKIGAIMKRVFTDWTKVYPNLMWWPRTFKVHGNFRWIFGLLGAYFLLIMSLFVIVTNKPIFYIKSLKIKTIRFSRRLKKVFLGT